MPDTMAMDFDSPGILASLVSMEGEALDELEYGVVGMKLDGTVTHYNHAESVLAGLDKTAVMGQHFFEETAPCMNNFLVAQKLFDEASVDESLSYVLTVRMKPTPVTLRLLKSSDQDRMFVLVRREQP